jgi:CheY-like chemotaxis protein
MMKKILFIDDEPQNFSFVHDICKEMPNLEIFSAENVCRALEIIEEQDNLDVVVTDIFIPTGGDLRQIIGPRARKYEENLRHLGGLIILDALELLNPIPVIITHTACTDFELLEVLGQHVTLRLPKPCSSDILLDGILQFVQEEPDDPRWTL